MNTKAWTSDSCLVIVSDSRLPPAKHYRCSALLRKAQLYADNALTQFRYSQARADRDHLDFSRK